MPDDQQQIIQRQRDFLLIFLAGLLVGWLLARARSQRWVLGNIIVNSELTFNQ